MSSPVVESLATVRSRARERLDSLSWVQKSLLWGAVLTVLWMQFTQIGLEPRLITDGLIFFVGPMALALTHGRDLGFQVDRRAIRNSLLLAAFVVPFYIVGSSLPSIRAFYPMWETSAAMSEFVPHAIKQFMLVVAVETYYRGLLCVGVGDEVGIKAAFISPFVYALHHASKPPIEILLSGPTDALFGVVDYKSESLLPSIVAHGLGLILLDWLVLHEPLIPPEQVVEWLQWLPV